MDAANCGGNFRFDISLDESSRVAGVLAKVKQR